MKGVTRRGVEVDSRIWKARIVDAPVASDRWAWAQQLGDQTLHRRLMNELDCLHETEGRSIGPDLRGWVRVVAWNVERGSDVPGAVALLAGCHADVVLLSELDSGLARTQDLDVPGSIAGGLGIGYVYGVEFIELVGDGTRGLHGNAVLSGATLADPAVIRLDHDGRWFAADSPEPRVGGRMAVLTTIHVDGTPVRVASTHLENMTDPDGRAQQLDTLLSAVGPGPALVGGDLNTFGTALEELGDRATVRRLRAAEPARFSWPVSYEPLFSVAASHGFEWVDANVAAPTTSHDCGGLPDHVPLKLDWLLVRALEARRPAVTPSPGLSDHQVVSVAVRPTPP
jgi:endonuclease/exonuclease/phosphatase family metal-dependent hydrolase